LALVLLVLGSGLLLDGYTHRTLGPAGTPAPGTNGSAGLAASGPVLDLSGPAVRSTDAPARTVALTFDDGPNPRWTPAILAVLRRYRVPATFFVVGSRALANPGLVRQELRAGDDVGSHTFVHADVAAIPGWQASLELSLTQAALGNAAGIHTGLFRPPYSSVPSAVTAHQLQVWRTIARQGYLVAVADRDSEDWRRPGVDRIVLNATPPPGRGSVILFHDGGGDRSQTVAALSRLIPALQARGDRFTTVSALAGLSHAQVDPTVGTGQRLQARTIAAAARVGHLETGTLTWVLLAIGILSVARALLLVTLARHHAGSTDRRRTDAGFTPPVSVVVPAYNEEVGIDLAVRALADSEYPDVEVVVVDDGSTDRTVEIVESLAFPNVVVVRQANAGKAAALNRGLSVATHDLIVTVDGDTIFRSDAIGWLVQPFADPAVGAVSGNTKIGNRRRLLGRWQHIEYVMGFNLDRRMYEVLGCMPTVPGAIGAFRRSVLEQVGGVSGDTLAEDTDLTMAVVRQGWKVVYEDRAVAWTEAPAELSSLWKQRYRWSYGTMQAMWKHRRAVAEGGPLGRRGLPYLLLFQVLLPLLAPAVDVATVIGILFLPVLPLLAFWVGFNLLSLAVAAYAFHLDHEPLRGAGWIVLQQFVYRQLMYLVVTQAVVTAVLGTSLRWHKLERTGGLETPGGPARTTDRVEARG